MLRLSEVISKVVYDENVKSCLKWDANTYSGKNNQIQQTFIGVEAGNYSGCDRKGYYYKFQFNRVKYLCHRVVWEIHLGEIPDGFYVDHRDGNTSNNKISNLRLVDAKINSRNRKIGDNNTSGVMGVQFNSKLTNKKIYNNWTAEWSYNGKKKSKSFSINKYGLLPAFAMACKWREDRIKELNEQGAGYTERHGT